MGQVRVGYLGVGRLVVKSCWGHAREARYIEKSLIHLKNTTFYVQLPFNISQVYF